MLTGLPVPDRDTKEALPDVNQPRIAEHVSQLPSDPRVSVQLRRARLVFLVPVIGRVLLRETPAVGLDVVIQLGAL
jgi:hypothetical protein